MTNPHGMSDQEYAEALTELTRVKEVARAAGNLLVKARVENNPAAGAAVAQQIFDAQDPILLMQILGYLVTLISELQASAHGPLAPPPVVTEPKPVWITHSEDQVAAAAAAGDGEAVGRIALEGQVRALRNDARDGLGYENVVASLLLMDQSALVLVLAAALTKMVAEDDGDRG